MSSPLLTSPIPKAQSINKLATYVLGCWVGLLVGLTVYFFFQEQPGLARLSALAGLFHAWLCWSVREYLIRFRGAGALFLTGLALRLLLIASTPASNQMVDLCMNRDMGQLITHGVDPYNFADKAGVRNALRTDSTAQIAFTADSQELWNYHAGSQLPLFLLTMGWIEGTIGTAWFHRVFYAVYDSLLGVLVLAFLTLNWPRLRRQVWRIGTFELTAFRSPEWILAAGLVSFSPLLLRSGVLIPEPKGITTFLLVGSLVALSQVSTGSIIKSGVLSGTSVAFMALGVFTVPLSLKKIAAASGPGRLAAWRFSAYWLLVAGFCGVFWLIPYLSSLVHMAENRLNFGSSFTIHASMWRLWAEYIPHWEWVKNLTGIAFLVTGAVGLLTRRLGWEVVTGMGLLYFLNFSTTDGSMDRLNIGLLVSVLLLGVQFAEPARKLITYHFLGGLVLLLTAGGLWIYKKLLNTPAPQFSYADGVFIFLFFIYYFKTVLTQVLNPSAA